MSRTKSVADKFLYFAKWLSNILGRHATRFNLDGGEYMTDEVRALAKEHGTMIVENIASVHSNHSIERRHRTLKEIMNAFLTQGGAGPHMWEFTCPAANQVINLTIKTAALRAVGRPGKGKDGKQKVRPLSPHEMVVNHGKLMDLKELWDNLHGIFQLGTGYLEEKHGHKERGFEMIYFGPVP